MTTKKSRFFRRIVVLLLGLGCGFVEGLPDQIKQAGVKQPNGSVEVAHRDPARATCGQGTTAFAFAYLANKLSFDRPLFVVVEEAENACIVEFFAIPEADFGSSLTVNTNNERRLASVRVTGDGASIVLSVATSTDGKRSTADDSVIAAISFLDASGSLPKQFRVKPLLMPNGERRVQLLRFPLKPGAHSTVTVTPSGLQVRPGR